MNRLQMHNFQFAKHLPKISHFTLKYFIAKSFEKSMDFINFAEKLSISS